MTAGVRMDLSRLAAGLLALLLAGCQSLPVDLDEKPGIARVYERYRSATQVERASETLFGAEAEDGSDAVILSDPKSRVGYQFEVALDTFLDVPEGASFRLELIRKEAQPPEIHVFPITRRPGWFFGEYVLRLTGAAAPDTRWRPVAWRISLVGPDGAVLAARRSFLWGAPTDLAPR